MLSNVYIDDDFIVKNIGGSGFGAVISTIPTASRAAPAQEVRSVRSLFK